jgi:hypothetical protein
VILVFVKRIPGKLEADGFRASDGNCRRVLILKIF